MAKRLTDSEYQALKETQVERFGFTQAMEGTESLWGLEILKFGFVAGLSYNQTKLDKLISYIKGEVTRSEIEDILE